MRGVFVAALLIAFAIAAPANPVAAQTQDGAMKSKTAAEKKPDYAARKAAKEAAKAEKAAARKAKADEEKAKAEEKKAAKAEEKAKSTSDRWAAKARQKECGAEWKAARCGQGRATHDLAEILQRVQQALERKSRLTAAHRYYPE